MKRYTYLFLLVITACNTGIPATEESSGTKQSVTSKSVVSGSQKTDPAKASKARGLEIPTDTAGIYYMQYLINHNKPLTSLLKEKLIAIDSSWFTEGIGASLYVKGLYQINDSVEAVHMEFGSDVGLEDYVLTFKNNHDFYKKLQISESYGRNPEQTEYAYREAQVIQDSIIQITMHTLYGTEEAPKDSIVTKFWKITGDGGFIKITD